MAAEQNQPGDANSRLKQRMRATVPPRNTSMLKRQLQEEEATAPETETSSKPTEKEKKLVSFTLRIEDSVDKGLKSLCTQENITKETFLEAAYLVCLENELLMQKVLEVAQARRQERRETGILRRAKSMTRYLQDS